MICGSEATGEEAAIYIWKRDSGELLSRIPGSGLVGHTNIISQVDGNQQEPYMFISCSDDEKKTRNQCILRYKFLKEYSAKYAKK